jgi:hypothetical protein
LRVTSFIGFRRVIGLTATGAGAEAGVEFRAGTSDVAGAGSEAVSVSGAGSGVAAASSRGRAQPRPRAVPEMTRWASRVEVSPIRRWETLGIEYAPRLRRWERMCVRSAGREGAGSEARRVWSRSRGSGADAVAGDVVEGRSSIGRPAIVRRHRRDLVTETY